MTDDIVERLRTEYDRFARVPRENKFWLGPLVHARLAVLFLESANHICHLRKERDEARRERYDAICERDDARQMVCGHGLFCLESAKKVAISRGWDCFEFKEDNHNA